MKLFLTLGVVFSLHLPLECMTLQKGPFQSLKAPSEIIHNFSVVHPHISDKTDSKNDKHPMQLTVSINEVTLHLTLNKGLFPAHFVSKHFNKYGEAVITRDYENCYYHGRVEGHPDWKVTMSTCKGLRGSFGDRINKEQFYHIEPLDVSNKQLDGPHVVYPESEYSVQETSCGTPHSPTTAPEVHNLPVEMAKHRLKRQNSLGELLVEWAVVNDARQIQQFGDSVVATTEHTIEMANYLDMLYRDEYQIRIVLTYVENWSAGDRMNIVSESSALLDAFENYSEFEISTHRDSTMLFTGIDLDGSTVGIANVAGMCSSSRSVGLTQDRGRSVESTGAVAAHELGHIFNMQHDDGSRSGCVCNDPTGGCIMASSGGFTPATVWSTCSREDLNAGFSQFSLDRCLANEPAMILGEPVCGNGLVEEGELCDCGPPDICPDPCCNATSCMLREGAECFTGACCNNCQYRPYGTTCRQDNNECGISEYCTGESSDCPDNFDLQDGTSCDGNSSYCFSGMCVTYDFQCQRYWGTNNGIDECYLENTRGTSRGNCGHNLSIQDYIPCEAQDVLCGVLFCQPGGTFNNVDNIRGFVFTNNVQDPDGNLQQCFGASVRATEDFQSPALVDDYTRCGADMVCFQRRCVPLSSLNIPSCPTGSNGQICSGNGVCNNDNMCSCIVGFTGSICGTPVSTGPSIGAIIGAIIAVLIILGLVVGGIVLTVYLVNKHKSSGKYTASSSRTTTSQTHPYRTNTSSKPSSSATTVNVRQPYKPPPAQPTRRAPPPACPAAATPPTRPPQPSRPPPQPRTDPMAKKPAARPPPPKPNIPAPQFTRQPPSKPVKPPPAAKPSMPTKPTVAAKPLPVSRKQWPPKQ